MKETQYELCLKPNFGSIIFMLSSDFFAPLHEGYLPLPDASFEEGVAHYGSLRDPVRGPLKKVGGELENNP